MTDRSHDLRTDDNAEGAPRWVKVSGVIGLVVLPLFVGALLFGGVAGHGPGRHGGDDPPASDSSGGHVPPAGGHG